MNNDDDLTTPWFDASTPPVREGPYRRRYPAGPFSCWTGQAWYGDAHSPQAAAAAKQASRHQQVPWQGLARLSDLPCSACKGHGVIDLGDDDAQGWPLLRECATC